MIDVFVDQVLVNYGSNVYNTGLTINQNWVSVLDQCIAIAGILMVIVGVFCA